MNVAASVGILLTEPPGKMAGNRTWIETTSNDHQNKMGNNLYFNRCYSLYIMIDGESMRMLIVIHFDMFNPPCLLRCGSALQAVPWLPFSIAPIMWV